MEEQKTVNFGGEAMPAETPAQMPAPEPMSANPMPSAEPQQPVSYTPAPTPEVERMQMPMQPIDSPVQSGGITMQMETPTGGGNKKIMIIVGVIIAAVLVVGMGIFFAWRAMHQPAVSAPVVEQPSTSATLPPVPATTEVVIIPPAPQQDDISVIEQNLNAFNVGGIDAEVQGNLSEISKSL